MTQSSTEESIALLLAPRASGQSVRLAASLIDEAGGIAALARNAENELVQRLRQHGFDRPLAGARTLRAALDLAHHIAMAEAVTPKRVSGPHDAAAWGMPRLGSLMHEELWLLALDARSHLRAAVCIAKGGLHGAAVRAADPLRHALRVGATAFVLVHNHPSGDETPSAQDIDFTRHVTAASEVIGVPMLDHVVVTRQRFATVPVDGAST